MHKIFGIKENRQYIDREGAHLIPIQNERVGVVQTPKGYFFLGGGLAAGENHVDCIARECMEEAGYLCAVNGRLCSAESYTYLSSVGWFHPIQTYYVGNLLEKVAIAIETDHNFSWVEYGLLRGNMYLEMQNWALEQAWIHMQNL